jgi:hypothetical protein
MMDESSVAGSQGEGQGVTQLDVIPNRVKELLLLEARYVPLAKSRSFAVLRMTIR